MRRVIIFMMVCKDGLCRFTVLTFMFLSGFRFIKCKNEVIVSFSTALTIVGRARLRRNGQR